MRSLNTLIVLAVALGAAPALAQTPAPAAPTPQANWWSPAGGEDGPARTVWAAQKTPETPYTGVNKPIWHIADILKAHQGQAALGPAGAADAATSTAITSRWRRATKTKCMFYADDRVFGWVYSGQVKITIDGQEPKVLPKGWAFNVGAAPVLLHGEYRHRTGGVLPHHARRARCRPIRKAKRPRRLPGYTMSRRGSPRPAAMTRSTCPSSMSTTMAPRTRKGERFLL